MPQNDGAQARADTPDASPVDRRFFGHPIGLMTLFGTELWERFSYYGMRAILLYYLTDTVADGGLGLDSDTGLAVTSIYGASVYLLSVVGGWLADRVIGSRRATLYGGMVIAAGHVLLAVPGGAGVSFAGIVCVAIGTGLLKPNVSSMVGELYGRDDERRDSGFSIFYMGINIGSFTAPFLVGLARSIGGYPPVSPSQRSAWASRSSPSCSVERSCGAPGTTWPTRSRLPTARCSCVAASAWSSCSRSQPSVPSRRRACQPGSCPSAPPASST
jgi:MFS family permease